MRVIRAFFFFSGVMISFSRFVFYPQFSSGLAQRSSVLFLGLEGSVYSGSYGRMGELARREEIRAI
jgi:hypothetical protein